MQKQDTFILDFYNSATEIKEAFDPFYTATPLSEPTDVNVLPDLKDAIDKIDFKIKAKQFVKLCGQLACIIPFPPKDFIQWEKLYWFLKFLIPKLKIAERDKDQFDELLESVDLAPQAGQTLFWSHDQDVENAS